MRKKNKFLLLFKNPHFVIPFAICVVGVLALSLAIPLSLANQNKTNPNHPFEKDFVFEQDENGYVITDYIGGPAQKVIVPSKIGNKEIYKVKRETFRQDDLIKEIVFEDGIKEIESYAYRFGSTLEKITLPKTLEVLGQNAFSITYNLENIEISPENEYFTIEDGCLFSKDKTILYRLPPKYFGETNLVFNIPEEVEVIKSGAFDSNMYLTGVTFPSSLKTIETNAFIDCYLFQSVELNEGLEKIEESAFTGTNRNLEYFYVPSTLKELGGNPVFNAPRLKSFDVSLANPYLESYENSIYSEDLKTLYAFPSLVDKNHYEVPEGVEKIGRYAFNNLANVENLVLPSTINQVSSHFIYSCNSLNNIFIKKGAQNFVEQAIFGCSDSNVYLQYPELPESFDENFCDGTILFEDDWVEPRLIGNYL